MGDTAEVIGFTGHNTVHIHIKEAADELGFIPASLDPPLQAISQAVQGGLGKMDIAALALRLQKES